MNYSYVIIDENLESGLKTKKIANDFSQLIFVDMAHNYIDGLNLILKHTPELIFIEIDPVNKESGLSLSFIDGLYRYLETLPKIIITTRKKNLAFDAIKSGVTDYILKPVEVTDFTKLIHKLNKLDNNNFVQSKSKQIDNKLISLEFQELVPVAEPLILCIKSYRDYRYIDAKDICFFKADNNSTDIHLNNGEMITAFKTLKYFENILSHPFIRIHKSYIVNRNYISRIHNGNAVCYIKNTSSKIPFSKMYRSNVNLVISEFSKGNYLEI